MGSFWDMPEAARRPVIEAGEKAGIHLGPDSTLRMGLVYNPGDPVAIDTRTLKTVPTAIGDAPGANMMDERADRTPGASAPSVVSSTDDLVEEALSKGKKK